MTQRVHNRNSYSAIVDSFEQHAHRSVKSAADKLTALVDKIFALIQEVLASPTRYIGSKNWSIPGLLFRLPGAIFKRIFGLPTEKSFKAEVFGTGYHSQYQKSLTPAELKEYVPFACAAATVHRSDPSWTEPLGYKVVNPGSFQCKDDSIEAKQNCFFDPQSGLKVMLIEKNGTVIITFGALDSHENELEGDPAQSKKLHFNGRINNWSNLLGLVPSIYEQANAFIEKIQKDPMLFGKKLLLTGQSYGGTLASYVSLKQQIPSICFNSVQLGAGLQQQIRSDALSNADQYVTHITVRGDYASDTTAINIVDQILSRIGIKTPGNFGKRYSMPSAFINCFRSHSYVLGSVMKYLGYTDRPTQTDIQDFHQENT